MSLIELKGIQDENILSISGNMDYSRNVELSCGARGLLG